MEEEKNSENARLILGDCMDAMRGIADNTFDSIVCDPPYGLNFMGKDFDNPKAMTEESGSDMEKFQKYLTPIFKEMLRVAKPGAHLLAFGGTRTFHRLACAIEDAGWECRDTIMYCFGSGFPKGMDVGKAIDRSRNTNHQRALEFTQWLKSTGITAEQIDGITHSKMSRRLLAADAAASIATKEKFDMLRPYLPPVPERIERLVAERTGLEWSDYAKREVVATRKNGNRENPATDLLLSQGETYDLTNPYSSDAESWTGWNSVLKPAYEPIIMARKPLEGTIAENVLKWGTGAINIDGCRVPTGDNLNGGAYAKPHDCKRDDGYRFQIGGGGEFHQPTGRYPANLIHDGSDEVLALFPDTGKSTGGRTIKRSGGGNVGSGKKSEAYWTNDDPGFGDSGSAARFFYCAKASRKERGEGNFHPTVKPLSLMRWLVRLVTRKGGLVLDPFMGSGTTGVACAVEGMRFVGCEKEPEYFEIAKRRIGGTGFGMEVEGGDDVEEGAETTHEAERQSAATSQPSKPVCVQGDLFG